MEKNEGGQLVRALGLKESISMTIGTVVGVGLFTCGSSQIGYVGSGIIVITFLSLLISIWPCLIYGEMSAALPCAGGTYNYAKRGLNRVWANLAGWHYIISVVGIGAGETLAFSNYFKILFGELGINIEGVDSRIIAIVLVLFFLILNFRGIEMSGKAQTGFIFFFWGCAVAWFLYMIPHIHLDYFGGIAMDSLPSFKEMMYIFGLVWWCYTGFETCVSMGAETKYPQYTLPRALKVSVFLVFAVNALFQWFLVGLVPHEFYHILAVADAPYAEGLRAAGLVGFPIILLCIGIAFGGDLSTINPGIAAPARYIYTMAEDGSLPKFLCKVHPKVMANYGIGQRTYVAVLDMPAVDGFASFDRKYEGIAKYPAVTRDISMVVPRTVLVGQIEKILAQRGGKILESYSLFDIYEGAQIKEGYKSIAYTLTFRAKDKTLEDVEITAAMKKILNGLEQLGIELRQ